MQKGMLRHCFEVCNGSVLFSIQDLALTLRSSIERNGNALLAAPPLERPEITMKQENMSVELTALRTVARFQSGLDVFSMNL
jgi:hypothetical protein